ncbi:hypothetical protein ACQJBY_018136 [Aegilops geniculata]
MARLSLAACGVAFHLCLLVSTSSSLRWLSDKSAAVTTAGGGSVRTRSAYHFQPAKNWQNGPMYHNGLYHFFYQYNPDGVTWGNGNLSWGHSVSVDLVNWFALDAALQPSRSFDANGCWSGSATILPDGSPVMLYTGIDARGDQVQNVAYPKNASDPLLVEWVKPEYNPVIPVPADIKRDDFRDPSTAWLGADGLWRIAVAARVHDVGGATLIYRSKDFLRWERNADPLYLAHAAGMVECPDLFPVSEPGVEGGLPASGAGARHVLKMSVMDTVQDYYVVGRYDDTADTFVPEDDDDCRSWRRLDYGHVYASKSFFDPSKNRRVLWGWANESDSVADDLVRGWSGVQSLCGEKGASVPGSVGPFGLLVMASGDMQEHTAVFFRVFRQNDKYKVLMCTDLSRSSTRDGVYKPPYGAFVDMDIEAHGGIISLRTLVDHSVVESFGGGGRACITARVYPDHVVNGNSHLYVFNNGTGAVKVSSLDAWEMATATVNVLPDGLIAASSVSRAQAY